MAKRAWSRAFTPQTDRPVRLHINNVPATLKERFAVKCRREGKSQRNLILGWIRNWNAGRRPDEDGDELPMASIDEASLRAKAEGMPTESLHTIRTVLRQSEQAAKAAGDTRALAHYTSRLTVMESVLRARRKG